MNYYRHYIGDYQRDTGHLSILEHGAYRLMLDTHYATEKPLPKGDVLYRLLRATTKDERAAVDSVLQQFWLSTDDGWVNPRGELEIEKAEGRAEINKANGRRGGKRNDTENKANGFVSGSVSLASDKATPLVVGNGISRFALDPKINPDLWAEFEAHRIEIRQPLSDRSRRANSKVLAALTPEQQQQSVDETIANRWRGLFVPKTPAAKSGNGSVPPITDERALESYGAKLGIKPRPGEQWNQFRSRVMQASR